MDFGDSFLPSELNAAYLWAQLEKADEINNDRLNSWNAYYKALKPLEDEGKIELPVVPADCAHNAHMFYIKCRDLAERSSLIADLKTKGINAVFHYIPLHSAPAGLKYGTFFGKDQYTTIESERLLRLPMYYGIGDENIGYIVESIKRFYKL